jgi:hypothetical protein
VSQVSHRRTTASLLAAIFACLAAAAPADAGFVPALGSPFSYDAPTEALAVADAERNGTVDVVAGAGTLSLRRGVGSGFLGQPLFVGAPGGVDALASGDLNGDGQLDYAVLAPELPGSPATPRRLYQYTALPSGGYGSTTVLADAGEARDLAIANVNGDGLPDLIVVRAESDPNVTVLRNLGGGDFADDDYESGISTPRDVAIGDLTGDGQPEIALVGGGPNVSVLVNRADGTFADGVLSATGAGGGAQRVAPTHLEGDGLLDLVATDSAGAVLALRGNGGGGLTSLGGRPTGLPAAPSSIAVGDVDGDGPLDVVAGSAGGRFAVLLGDGSGGMAPAPGSPFATDDAAAGTVEDIAAVDMNRDSQVDVVTANRPGSVSVLLNSDTGLIQALPSRIDLGAMPALAPAQTRTVTFRSLRGQLRITRVDMQGSSRYSAPGNGCLGHTLLLGQSCSMTVSFRPPRRAGRIEALLSIDANAAATVVPLTATIRPPIVGRARLAPKRVKAGKRLSLRYRLSEAARVRVRVQQALPGRRVAAARRAQGGRRVAAKCVTPRRGNLKRRRCTIWRTVATVSRRDDAGANRLRVATRVKRRALRPGAYRLSVSATDRFRNRSKEKLLRFKVLRAAKKRAPK